jgi:hypothetical protein
MHIRVPLWRFRMSRLLRKTTASPDLCIQLRVYRVQLFFFLLLDIEVPQRQLSFFPLPFPTADLFLRLLMAKDSLKDKQ